MLSAYQSGSRTSNKLNLTMHYDYMHVGLNTSMIGQLLTMRLHTNVNNQPDTSITNALIYHHQVI